MTYEDPRRRVDIGDEPTEEADFQPETVNPSVHAIIPNPSVRTRLLGRVEKSE